MTHTRAGYSRTLINTVGGQKLGSENFGVFQAEVRKFVRNFHGTSCRGSLEFSRKCVRKFEYLFILFFVPFPNICKWQVQP